jgi:hypothetical protein
LANPTHKNVIPVSDFGLEDRFCGLIVWLELGFIRHV